MWIVEFYTNRNGNCPARSFILKQQKHARTLILEMVEKLGELGYQLRFPHAKQIGDGLYELRIREFKNRFRLLYFFYDQDKIVITHGLQKKQGELEQADIDKAKAYRADYIDQKQK